MWLMAFGSAIHKQSSCHTQQWFRSRVRLKGIGVCSIKNATYPKGTVPTDDIPEILEEPLLRSSSFLGQEIPPVSLKGFT